LTRWLDELTMPWLAKLNQMAPMCPDYVL